MAITWKRSSGLYTGTIYTGTMADTNDYYAVSKRGAKWECWIAGQYLGSFSTMRVAKETAALHAAATVTTVGT